MEEIIKTGGSAAGRGIPVQAAGILALLGTAVILNQTYSGTKGKAEDRQITNVESEKIAGSVVKIWNPDDRVSVLDDVEGLVLKKLLLQDCREADLVLAEKAEPERTLVLPVISDGDVWGTMQQEISAETPGDWAADGEMTAAVSDHLSDGGKTADSIIPDNLSGEGASWNPVQPEIASREETAVSPVTPAAPENEGTAAEPTVPAAPSDEGTAVKPIIPAAPGDEGTAAEPIVPDTPEDEGTVVEPIIPDTPGDEREAAKPIIPVMPGDEGTAVEPIVPDTPGDEGTAAEPIVPDTPGDEGGAAEPIAPDTPGDEGGAAEPIVPDTPGDGGAAEPSVPDRDSSDSAAGGEILPDTGGEDNADQGTVSCFLLDEMGMLCGFLPEYAEISDGCLTLPAECTGIRRGAFSGGGAGILELYIPAGTAVIEEGALADLISLEWIDVESGNPGCVSDCGVLFDSTMSVLLAFPAAWMDIYAVPPCVARIADRAFDGTSIYRLDIRECTGLSFGQNVFGSSGGNGIQVAVPESELEMYAEMLAGYAVTLTK